MGFVNDCYNMIGKSKVRKIGNSYGIILPKEALDRLKVEEGSALYLTESPDGNIRLTAGNPEFERMMAIGDNVMRRYRNALRELAK